MTKQEIEKALAKDITERRLECPVCIDYEPLEVIEDQPWSVYCAHCELTIDFVITLTKKPKE